MTPPNSQKRKRGQLGSQAKGTTEATQPQKSVKVNGFKLNEYIRGSSHQIESLVCTKTEGISSKIPTEEDAKTLLEPTGAAPR